MQAILPQNDLLHFFLIQEHLHGILNVKNYSMRSSTFIHFFSSEKRSIDEFVLLRYLYAIDKGALV